MSQDNITPIILDGKSLSLEIKDSLKKKVQKYTDLDLRRPGVCIISVGNDNSSEVYIRHKLKMCNELGFYSRHISFSGSPSDGSQSEGPLLKAIYDANIDPKIDGILIQLPLPKHLNVDKILNEILPEKDVDGMSAVNIGNLALRKPTLRCCTPYGIMTLLEHYNVPIKGKHVVIVGASNIVGRPMALEMLLAGATTTVCHRFTENLERHVSVADILIVSVGKRGIIKSEWIKRGSVVVDVGINRDTGSGTNDNAGSTGTGKLCGDVDFETAKEKTSFITPVPGGVGPMTVIALMKNLIQIYESSNII